ncbi:MAG TPA: hypothetical protein VKN99_18615 [Polyangia bacterium]|nr:hypothetical protein [Polyangia bacterium]
MIGLHRAVLMGAAVAVGMGSCAGSDQGPAPGADGQAAASCRDGIRNGTETDIDCGGTCPPCADLKACAAATDCSSGVCMRQICQVPTCQDGVRNQGETNVDCGGPCPITFSGAGCVNGVNGATLCTSYTSGDKFRVMLTWNASGGNAYVNYATAYNTTGEFNTMGVRGGSPVNICTTGPVTQTFDLPLGRGYTFKIWRAYCVRTDACSGCGNDAVIDMGGPFGIDRDCV